MAGGGWSAHEAERAAAFRRAQRATNTALPEIPTAQPEVVDDDQGESGRQARNLSYLQSHRPPATQDDPFESPSLGMAVEAGKMAAEETSRSIVQGVVHAADASFLAFLLTGPYALLRFGASLLRNDIPGKIDVTKVLLPSFRFFAGTPADTGDVFWSFVEFFVGFVMWTFILCVIVLIILVADYIANLDLFGAIGLFTDILWAVILGGITE